MSIKLNSLNFIMLEGVISDLTNNTGSNGKDSCSFILKFYHASKPDHNKKITYYSSFIPVAMYGSPAMRCLTTYRNGDLVIVQGHIRQHESTRYKLVAVHLALSTPVLIDDKNITVAKESSDGDES